MSGKNKGGREVRKPKQPKAVKATGMLATTVAPPTPKPGKQPR